MPLSDQDNSVDAVAHALYELPPEEFVPARDDRVTAARQRGDRELARAIGRLRRPTRAAWLANLLARHRAEQIEGLVGLAAGLTQAQRTLDGDALRALATQRHRAVAAMARDAARLAQAAGSPATDAQLRELQGILEAALAQPEVAQEVRSGRLTRTLRYTGFGPEADPGATPTPAQSRSERGQAEGDGPETGNSADAERAERERALADAERDAAAARERQEADDTARDAARERHDRARDRVASLTAELSAARADEHAAAEASKVAAAAARESGRAVTAAAARAEQARARLGR
ncbi:MAG: hypothetical protein ACR2GH_23515 [Pseudonocardia sp.]